MKFRIGFFAVLGLAIIAVGATPVAQGADDAAKALKITRQLGTYANVTVTLEETTKKTEPAGDKQRVTEVVARTEGQNGLIFGDKTDAGWQIVSATVISKTTLKSYTVDGADKKMQEIARMEAPRLPIIRTLVGDEMARENVPAQAVAEQELWEGFAVSFTRVPSPDGLKDGAKWNGDITIGGEKVGTYEFTCKLVVVAAADEKTPPQYAVTGKITAQRKEGSVAIDDYNAIYDVNGLWPKTETYTSKIVRNKEKETTEVTRAITRELDQAKVLDGDALKAVTGIYGLTTKALDAVKKIDITFKNYNDYVQKRGAFLQQLQKQGVQQNEMSDKVFAFRTEYWAPVKVAANALYAAQNAAPKQSILGDALYAWYANVSIFMTPEVGTYFKPAQVSKWINSDGIDMHALQGKVVAVEIWATWCPPCVQSAPHLDGLLKTYSAKGLVIMALTVHQQGTKDEVEFSKENKLTYPIGMDKMNNVFDQTGRVWADQNGRPLLVPVSSVSYDPFGIPAIHIYDKKGVLRWVGMPMDPQCEETIKKLVDEK
jgi:thiol-disulfide isomerase/thioredoxin